MAPRIVIVEDEEPIASAVGADDYLTKPFSPRELVARIRTVLRRGEWAETLGPPLRLGRRRDRGRQPPGAGAGRGGPRHSHRVRPAVAAGRPPGVVCTREQLLAEVRGYRDGSGVRTVDRHIRSLRGKLGSTLIRTVRGVGDAADA